MAKISSTGLPMPVSKTQWLHLSKINSLAITLYDNLYAEKTTETGNSEENVDRTSAQQ